MGSERQTWYNLKKQFDGVHDIHYQRIEDTLTVGIPDVYLNFRGKSIWLELKQLDAFPMRSPTPVRLNFKREQFLWILIEQACHGKAGLITQVGCEYFYHEYPEVLEAIVGCEFNTEGFRGSASITHAGAPNFVGHFLKALEEDVI